MEIDPQNTVLGEDHDMKNVRHAKTAETKANMDQP